MMLACLFYDAVSIAFIEPNNFNGGAIVTLRDIDHRLYLTTVSVYHENFRIVISVVLLAHMIYCSHD
jgi:hypothetical protein